MNQTITMTTKGTFTMPAKIRKQLGVNKQGDKLIYTYDEKNQRLIIEKPRMDFKEIQDQLRRHIDPSIPPLMDVDKFYQDNRNIT